MTQLLLGVEKHHVEQAGVVKYRAETARIYGSGVDELFTTFAVLNSDQGRRRFFVGSFETQDEAMRAATVATFGTTPYAVVHCPSGATLICLKTPPDGYLAREPEKLHFRAPRPYSPDDE